MKANSTQKFAKVDITNLSVLESSENNLKTWKELFQEILNRRITESAKLKEEIAEEPKFKFFDIEKVFRIENSDCWKVYQNQCLKIEKTSQKYLKNTPFKTEMEHPLFEKLDLDPYLNEILLFYGPNQKFVDTISKTGIHEQFSTFSKAPGIFFSENAIKSDQLISDHFSEKTFSLFVCRVVLGNYLLSHHPYKEKISERKGNYNYSAPLIDPTSETSPAFDSLVIESKRTCKDKPKNAVFLDDFREFVIFDPKQCYCEFLIEYKKV